MSSINAARRYYPALASPEGGRGVIIHYWNPSTRKSIYPESRTCIQVRALGWEVSSFST